MKKCDLCLALAAIFFTVLCRTAAAVPTLQVYTDGLGAGDQGPDQDTWFTNDNPFTITVVAAFSAGVVEFEQVTLLVSVPQGESGSITVDGTVLGPVYDLKSEITPPPGGPTFNNHYPTGDGTSDFMIYSIASSWRISDATTQNAPDYNAETGIIGTGNRPAVECDLLVEWGGYSNVHIDVYALAKKSRNDDGTWKMNPGSHDVTAVPAPGALLLSCVGLGLLRDLRRRAAL